MAAVAGAAVRRYATMLPIRSGRETIRLDVATIDWIDAAGDYMCLHAGGQTHVLRATMKELEDMLDPSVFQRVHRSTIVNLARVRSLRPHVNGECFLRLQSGQEHRHSDYEPLALPLSYAASLHHGAVNRPARDLRVYRPASGLSGSPLRSTSTNGASQGWPGLTHMR